MGADKARLRLGGRTLLAHIRASARLSGCPHRVLRRDLLPGRGPLGGVHTGLATSRADAVLFLSCDMPFLSARLIRMLLRRWNGRQAAVFVRADGRAGFPFLVSRESLPAVERLLAERRNSLQQLATALRAQVLGLPRRWHGDLLNINTRDDWAAARARWRTMRSTAPTQGRSRPR